MSKGNKKPRRQGNCAGVRPCSYGLADLEGCQYRFIGIAGLYPMSFSRRAITTAAVREATFIFFSMCETCLLAVSGLMPSTMPISLSDLPLTTSCSTVSSRKLSP